MKIKFVREYEDRMEQYVEWECGVWVVCGVRSSPNQIRWPAHNRTPECTDYIGFVRPIGHWRRPEPVEMWGRLAGVW